MIDPTTIEPKPVARTPAVDLQFFRSEKVGEIVKALAAAQGEMDAALKDAQNPHFHSTFATLKSVVDVIREPLSKAGIAWIQPTIILDGKIYLDTTLLLGEQFLGCRYPLTVGQQTPQGVGSALTYARRYSLQALVGVPSADDDGEEAHGRGSPQPAQARPAQQSRPAAKPAPAKSAAKPAAKPAAKAAEPPKPGLPKKTQGWTKERWSQFLAEFGWTEEQAQTAMRKANGLKAGQNPTQEMLENLKVMVRTTPPEEALGTFDALEEPQ